MTTPDEQPENNSTMSDDNQLENEDVLESQIDEIVIDTTVDNQLDADDSKLATQDIQDITLAQLLGNVVRAPRQTSKVLVSILNDKDTNQPIELENPISSTSPNSEITSFRFSVPFSNIDVLQLSMYIIAFLLAWWGTSLMVVNSNVIRSEQVELVAAIPFVILGWLVWIFADLTRHRMSLITYLRENILERPFYMAFRITALLAMLIGFFILADSTDEPRELVLEIVLRGVLFAVFGVILWVVVDGLQKFAPVFGLQKLNDEPETDVSTPFELPWYMRIHPFRIVFFFLASFLSILTWMSTANNTITTTGFYIWMSSIVAWVIVFIPENVQPITWATNTLDLMRRFSWSKYAGILIALILILSLAATFRLTNLTGDPSNNTAIPQEMTSDHVEKILDGWRVDQGFRNIWFANNGGREPFQMYALAIFAQLPGQDFNFDTLKLLAVIESLIAIPILFWFGYEVFKGESRRLAVIVGLLLAAFIAASYWHTVVTRLALRIILTPTMTALMFIYLMRAIRHNQRADFIKVGLVLGFGLYMYQAIRMLPLVILVAVGIAVYFYAKHWQDRAKYIANLSVLVSISFVIFLPLFHYSTENPDQFLRRTVGRLLGDDLITETLDDGTIIEREVTFQERIDAFGDNLPVLMSNIRNAVLMFNWKGDVAWINGYSNYPAMDAITGAFLLVGMVAWISLMIRRRDPVFWIIPISFFIMLLPSALSIAFPIENPSHTRTSGAMPFAYLIAAYPLALIIDRLLTLLPSIHGRLVAVGISVFLIMSAYNANTSVYFNEFAQLYIDSSLPYSEAGEILEGFAISDGSYGNAFMIAYPFWWDHRAIGIAGGRVNWPNGIVTLDDVPRFLSESQTRNDEYLLDIERDLLFFYNVEDEETQEQLRIWFPAGRELRIDSYHDNDDFMIYRVPALGSDSWQQFLFNYVEQR